MYKLFVYGNTPSGIPYTTLASGEFSVKGWTKRINSPGKLVWRISANRADASEALLKPWRKVIFYRKSLDGMSGYLPQWSGVIEAVNEVGDEIEVLCAGGLSILSKRFCGAEEVFDGVGSTEVFDLLAATNSLGATGISAGTGNVVSTRDLTIDAKDILSCLEDLGRAHEAEFEVDDTFALNFVSALGSDKSSSLHLFFERGVYGNSVKSVQRGRDGKTMANRLYATSTGGGGLTSTVNNTDSQTEYGIILVDRVQINEAQDQTTLDKMAQSIVDQIAEPASNLRLMPIVASKKLNIRTGEMAVSGLQYEDIVVGDLINTTITTAGVDETEARRIAEISVQVGQDNKESISLTLSKAGVFVTASYLDDNVQDDLKKRIRQLEKYV